MKHDIFVMRACVARYLDSIRLMDSRIRELELRIRDVRSRVELMGASLDGGGKAGGGDRVADGVARIAELEAEWSERVRGCMAEVERVRDWCDPSHVGRYAMWMHVVERRTWAYVGRVIGYSERQARTIADAGARELYCMIPEEYRRYTFPNAEDWRG